MNPLFLATALTAEDIKNYFSGDLIPRIVKFLLQVGVAILAYFIVSKMINKVTRWMKTRLEKRGIDRTRVEFLANTTRVILKILLVVTILLQLGMKSATLVAVFGSVSVGIGLALQGGMANFAGGVLITFVKPFAIGDYIIEASGKTEGTVEKIDMFYTTLRTYDDQLITIPNQVLTNNTVINLTKAGTRRVRSVVGISYKADIDRAKAVLSRLAEEETCRLPDRPCAVYVDALADSSVNLVVQFYTKTEDYFATQWRLTENIKKAFDAENIEIPFPQVDVHFDQNTEGNACREGV
ncbi:MAG: mechanosensitive ion channel family protein [Lachnospiraceae bacterium]|nr:mechanosensitive ion channel family protein [Lachnospiraceae bacterium]